MAQRPVLLGKEETIGTQGGPLAGARERDQPWVQHRAAGLGR